MAGAPRALGLIRLQQKPALGRSRQSSTGPPASSCSVRVGWQRFGFEGDLLESMDPYRAVTTEQMVGTDGPATRNEMTLTPVEGGTLLSLLITHPSKELRDMILGTGMTTGMETRYARLEQDVLAE